MPHSTSSAHPRPRSAMTLAEVLVVVGLLALATALGFALLGNLVGHSLRGLAHVEMQQQALMALNRLSREMQNCVPESISRHRDPFILALNPLAVGPQGEVMDNAGKLRWSQNATVYFLDPAQNHLKARQWPRTQVPGDPTDPQLLTLFSDISRPKNLPSAALLKLANPLAPCDTVAQEVISLTLSSAALGADPNSDSLIQPLRFKLVLQRSISGKTVRKEFTRTVFLAGSP